MSVVDRIRQEMKKRNISQNRLARAAQISQSGLSSILSGDSSPKESTLQAIAAALNMSVSELMEEQPSPVNYDPWNPDMMDYAAREDENIRVLTRGVYKMTPENRQKLLDVARVMFREDFDVEGNKK